ncbi:RHS repeat domain-containing protein [uncultured Aquimarina sp.]|uniref:RHS repeat domain-containing protein n=1 Tax=uncultured Aquimarina sp. TaxID=575652 RepID=UPI0026165B25|nr:RHS repeat domain-containing protein [uncultured Aquimarina sp.]
MKNISLFLTLFLITSLGYAQTGDSGGGTTAFDYTAELSRSVTIPNSPEAQAFIKYGNVPLNQYTGTPNISIPICEISGKSISLPISMTYDASGIKVNQLATKVGLGWNLNYGGVVSRQVHGLPDQADGTYAKITDPGTRAGLDAAYNNAYMGTFSTVEAMDAADALLTNYGMNNIDTQADTFSFSINGLSGTIGINYDVTENGKYQIFCIDNPEVKIDYTLLGDQITNWIITDTQGTRYEFAKAEFTHTSYSTQQNEYTAEYISSWYVTKIETANKEDVINYYYGNGAYYAENQRLPLDHIVQFYQNVNSSVFTQEIVAQHKQTIYKIQQFNPTAIFHNGKLAVDFGSGLQREDLLGQSAITSINAYNTLGQTIKAFELDYSYFVSESGSGIYPAGDKRLKLDAIREVEVFSDQGTVNTSPTTPKEKTHRFDYFNPTQLPHISSHYMDLWGYYNGGGAHITNVVGNRFLFNEQYGLTRLDYDFPGSDRTSKPQFAINGTLQKITYPTGGSTEFFFNGHSGPLEEEGTINLQRYTTAVQGGSDNPIASTNDLNDCPNIDDIEYLHNLQNIANGGFTIDALNANKAIAFDATFNNYDPGNPLADNGVTFVCVYKSRIGTGQCVTSPCPDFGLQPNGCSTTVTGDTYTICDTGEQPLTYCDIMTSNPATNPKIVYFSTTPDSDFILQLEEGDYRILLVNGNANTALNVQYDLLVEQEISRNNMIGGLRLVKTEDKPSENSNDVLAKYYYYNTLPENGVITPSIIEGNYASSGVVHQKLFFSDVEIHNGLVRDGVNVPDVNLYKFYSSNLAPKAKYNIAYTDVSEIRFKNNQYQGHTVYSFYNEDDGVAVANRPYFPRYHLNGRLKTTTHYNDQRKMVQQSSQSYSQQTLSTTMPHNGVFMIPQAIAHQACKKKIYGNGTYTIDITLPNSLFGVCDAGGELGPYTKYFANKYRLTPVWTRLESKTEKQFFEDQIIEQKTEYFYDNDTHKQMTRTQTTKNNGEIAISKMYYPQDRAALGTLPLNANKAIDVMIDTYRIGMPLQVEQYTKQGSTNTLLAKQRTDYKLWGTEKQVFPETIYTSKGTTALEPRMRYHQYDTKGNPLEVSQTNGASSIYIWGYEGKYPVAKIENATYSQITSRLATIQSQSNQDDDNTIGYAGKEGALRETLDQLREAVPNALITSYTYDPMIGVTSITDPKGYTMYYEYDGFNRLVNVKDGDGNILSENEYHYKNN